MIIQLSKNFATIASKTHPKATPNKAHCGRIINENRKLPSGLCSTGDLLAHTTCSITLRTYPPLTPSATLGISQFTVMTSNELAIYASHWIHRIVYDKTQCAQR